MSELAWGPIQGPMTWYEAKKLETDEWRLPTVQELVGAWDYESGKPMSGFEDMLGKFFWTGVSYASNTTRAWGVNFGGGDVDYNGKTGSYCVRCVRRGPGNG